jgi:tetratricopeptide (TPR) repeat protein
VDDGRRGRFASPGLRARALAWQSRFARVLGRAEDAQSLLDRARALVDEGPANGDEDRRASARAFVRLQLGYALSQAGDYPHARRQFGQSLALYRALGDTWGTAGALSALGQVAHSLSSYDEARGLLDESLALYRTLGDRRGIADALRTLGHLALAQGLAAEGAALLKESTGIRKELGDRTSLALGLADWATMLNYSGEFDRSYELFQEALAYYQDLGNRPLITIVHADLANAESHRGHYDRARVYGEQALALARDVGDLEVVMRTLFVLGGVLLAAGRPAEARPMLWQSSELYRASGQQNALAVSLGALGGAALQLGDLAAARQYLTEALRIAVALRTFVPKAVTLALTARLLAEQGQVEQAVELYALLERYPFVARSHFFADVAGRPVAAAAAALPADVIAGARASARSATWTIPPPKSWPTSNPGNPSSPLSAASPAPAPAADRFRGWRSEITLQPLASSHSITRTHSSVGCTARPRRWSAVQNSAPRRLATAR